jgi:hypothetical protein
MKNRLLTPRVKSPIFEELDEEIKDFILSEMVQFFGLSDPADFFEMDISQLEDAKLSPFIARNSNVHRTGFKYPSLYPLINPYIQRDPFQQSIPPREMELIILRTGWLCQSDYICLAHIGAGHREGLTVEEIVRIFGGLDSPGWDQSDLAILRAIDELHKDYFIDDDTWDLLSQRYNEQQRLELILIVGSYTQIAMFVNSVGVQMDYTHDFFSELAGKINDDDRIKKFFESRKELAVIYKEEIIEGNFEQAKKKLINLAKRG